MKNQRGMLLVNETLKIVLSVIAIGFLVFFLISLYMAKIHDSEFKEAEATIHRIINISKNTQNVLEEVNDPTPAGWSIYSFTGNDKPNSCAGLNCLCICEDVWFDSEENQAEECEDEGICEIIENLGKFEEIEIEDPPFALEIIKQDRLFIRKK